MRKFLRLVAGLAVLGGALASGCAAATDEDVAESAGETSSDLILCPTTGCAAQEGTCCGPTAFAARTCADGSCDRWPSGIIYYDWPSADKPNFVAGLPPYKRPSTEAEKNVWRNAMRDWERLTHGAIRFVKDSTKSPRLHFYKGSPGDGLAKNYRDCVNHFNGGDKTDCLVISGNYVNLYHELGHSIFGPHYWERNDAAHYFSIRNQPENGQQVDQCAGQKRYSSPDFHDYGPFDFKSTLLYSANHPGHTRYDGSALCGTNGSAPVCSLAGGPGCAGDDPCAGGTVDPATGWIMVQDKDPAVGKRVCAKCTDCRRNQPFGLPTTNDAGGVVEHYLRELEPQWKGFRRIVNEGTVDAQAISPWDYKLAPGVTVSTVDGTPAIAQWGSTLSVHVLGSDKQIYGKSNNVGGNPQSWTAWTPLGCCFKSAPSAVSWATGRTDLVAVGEDDSVYIKSFAAGSWTSWQNLFGPVGSAPSITSWGTNRLDIFVKDKNSNALLVKSCTGNCTGGAAGFGATWQAKFPNGAFVGRPSAVSRGNGLIDIFVHGEDHRLYGNWYHNGVAGSWYLVDEGPLDYNTASANQDRYSPAVAARASDILEIFARGVGRDADGYPYRDNMMSVKTWQNNVWGSFKPLGGNIISAPGTVTNKRSSNRSDVMAVMAEETTFNGSVAQGVFWKERTP